MLHAAGRNDDPTVGELDEATILGAILRRIGVTAAEVGPGDDAAVLEVDGGRVVATTDTLVHGPDFRLAWSTAYDLGWKAGAVNLADVAAMGARPTALLVALAMPDDTRLSFVEALADGLRDACEILAPGSGVAGGDLTVSPTLTIAVTALGELGLHKPVLRSGAREGDVVALAGPAGLAARGLDILFRRFRRDDVPVPVDRSSLDAEERDAVDAQLRPHPPIEAGVRAAAAGATAMLDVSDGLLRDASRVAAASGVTLDLSAAALPGRFALAGGEDHALLATFPPDVPLPEGFRRIGSVVRRRESAVTVDGAVDDGSSGWDPYRDWDSAAG